MVAFNNQFGIIWDMDGVLADTGEFHYQANQRFFNERGIPFDRQLFNNTFGLNNRAMIKIMLNGRIDERLVDDLTEIKEQYYRDAARGNLELLPNVKHWLSRSRELGLKQAVSTSAPQANLDFLMDETGLRPMFDIICSAFDQPGKPNPATYNIAAHKLGLAPSHCVVIEDAIAGVEGAKRGGFKCIAVTTTNPPENLQKADLVVENLDTIQPEILFSIFGLKSNSSPPINRNK